MKKFRHPLLLNLLALSAGVVNLPSAHADTDNYGSISTNSVTIGGEKLAVDPRSGTLNYRFNFFKGNVNYGQTPLELSLVYQTSAAGTYVGNFTDSHSHTHPYGVSAYLPTALPESTQPGGQDNDAGGVWDLNLPVLYVNTALNSKYYGKGAFSDYTVTASLSLGDTSYQYVLAMTDTSKQIIPTPWDDWTSAFAGGHTGTAPLYSKDANWLSISTFPLSSLPAGLQYSIPVNSGATTNGVLVQDKNGVNYYFAPAVVYGWRGPNSYSPTYSPNDDSDTPTMDEVLVYRIARIVYPNGNTLGFRYTDDFAGNTVHTVTVLDSNYNTVASFNYNTSGGTVSVLNQQANLAQTHQVTFTGADYRIQSIQNVVNNRSINYSYTQYTNVPYSWNNQTALTSITNGYTGYSTALNYTQFNAEVYDAGCNEFYLGQVALTSLTNNDNNAGLISLASYDYGFANSKAPNFVVPLNGSNKVYGAGQSHWLDNFFYNNQDSSGCSAGDTGTASVPGLTYGTTINTSYPDPNRNRSEMIAYDALGRTKADNIDITSQSGGAIVINGLTNTSHTYANSLASLQGLGSFDDMPSWYASPASTTSGMNVCTLNGTVLSSAGSCWLNPTQSWIYDSAGNPTQETSPLGQLTEYTYLPASQTSPANERLAQVVKTHSIGNNGAAYMLETQTFQNITVAPAGSGALAQMTLPLSNTETRSDTGGTAYGYRTDSVEGYVTGNSNPVLNGMATARTQTDNTGVSDVKSLTTQYSAPSLTSLNGQSALLVSSTLSGQATGGSASRNRGGAWFNLMGYPLQTTDGLGRATTQTFDSLGRITKVTTLAGTLDAQTTTTAYDDALSLAPQAINGTPVGTPMFSLRKTDPFGNQTVQLFDARQRHIASFQQLRGNGMVQTEGFLWNPTTAVLQTSVRYGNNYQYAENYYYAPGTSLKLATVPSVGLARGNLIDSINGNTLTFSYQPGATPTTIQQIYGPVSITHADNLSHLVLTDGLIDADAATRALQGFDLVNGPAGASMGAAPSSNLWFSSAGQAPSSLATLYQAISQHPASQLTTTDSLLEVNVYGYDLWNRKVSTSHYTFVNTGTAAAPVTTLSATTTTLKYNTAQRATTTTYPQGQQYTSTYNLLNGLQTASLMVNGTNTTLGGFSHDGLGRVIAYQDSLNGGTASNAYDPTTGLLTTRIDVYGNTLSLGYDPTSFQLTDTSLTPAGGDDPITVSRSYNTHLQLTQVQDGQGNTYGRSYATSGLLAGTSTLYAVQAAQTVPNAIYQASLSYDSYGDLTQVTDPFLPYSFDAAGLCVMETNPMSDFGYTISRDSYGRINGITNPYYNNLFGTLAYDPVTGLLTGRADSRSIPPAQATACGNAGTLTLTTSYVYDDNLRTIGKSVSRSDLSSTNSATPSGVADIVLNATAPTRLVKGRVASYDLTVVNRSASSGGHTASHVSLNIQSAGPAAAGLSYVHLPRNCQPSGSRLACQLSDLQGKGRQTLTLRVRPAATGKLDLTVQAMASAIDPNPANQMVKTDTNVCSLLKHCPPGKGVRRQPVLSGAAGVAQFTQSFDPAGHIVASTRQDFSGTSLNESYAYDGVTGALTSYTNSAGSATPHGYLANIGAVQSVSYTYDLYGNLTSANASGPQGAVNRTYANDAVNPFRLDSIFETQSLSGGTSTLSGNYVYDIAGNATQDAYGRQFGYDPHGLVSTITRRDGAQESFIRDGLGHTVQRQASWLSGPVNQYGSASQQINNATGMSNWLVNYPGGVAQYASDGSPIVTQSLPDYVGIGDPQGRPVNSLAYPTSGNTGYQILANSSQLPFGVVTNLTNANAGYPNGLDNATQYPDAAFGTANGADIGTGLEIKGDYRAYDPVIGRFLQMDSASPFGAGGLNGYAYASNDPVNFGDPTGHYAEEKAQRYGPKPPGANHQSFGAGFLAGLKGGAKSTYMTPYHWAKEIGKDISSGNMVGLLKMDFNAGVDMEMMMAAPGADMVLSEFVSTDASNIFSGKSPFKTHIPLKGSAYEIGYQLGDQTAVAGEMVAVAVIAEGVGEALDTAFAEVEIPEISADADTMADARQIGKTDLGPARPQQSGEQVPGSSSASSSDDEMSFLEVRDSDVRDHGDSTMKYRDFKKIKKVIKQVDGDKRYLRTDVKNDSGAKDINSYMNKLLESNFKQAGIDFDPGDYGRDYASAFRNPRIIRPRALRWGKLGLGGSDSIHGTETINALGDQPPGQPHVNTQDANSEGRLNTFFSP